MQKQSITTTLDILRLNVLCYKTFHFPLNSNQHNQVIDKKICKGARIIGNNFDEKTPKIVYYLRWNYLRFHNDW